MTCNKGLKRSEEPGMGGRGRRRKEGRRRGYSGFLTKYTVSTLTTKKSKYSDFFSANCVNPPQQKTKEQREILREIVKKE
jgi:hypothetical protein